MTDDNYHLGFVLPTHPMKSLHSTGTVCCHSWAAIKELDGICSLPYVWQLAVTFKIQRSRIKMLSIMWIRLRDVAVTELSSEEAMLITHSPTEKEITFRWLPYRLLWKSGIFMSRFTINATCYFKKSKHILLFRWCLIKIILQMQKTYRKTP